MLNKIQLIGRLGQNPEVRYSQAGKPVCNFSLATTETWKGKDGNREEKTEWHKIVIWGELAEVCKKYLSKGSLVYIEGKIQTRNWQDKDGATRYSTEVLGHGLRMLGGKSRDGSHEGSDIQESAQASEPSFSEDDIPF